VELTAGKNGLTPEAGFANQGELLVKSRQASDVVGATKMDRPEWIAVDPKNGEVYCTLTNNSDRGGKGRPAPDAANPRANNTMGHIIRWKEDGDFDATTFTWNHFVLAGDPANERPEAKGNIRGDLFASPDGLWFDDRGTLWIQTDMAASAMNKGDYARVGNNAMLAADVTTGEVRRFLVGPTNSEITGIASTPDLRTLFINIQHPGETPSERSDPAAVTRFSTWPDGGRPRSATVVIRKRDGGIIGT
jgi:secreted PhoX family phosphatase